jgi:hypothetical protein
VSALKPEKEDVERIECSAEGTKVEFQVGESFYYQFRRHGSVGIDAEFEIADTTVVEHVRTKTEYLHPERMKPGWTGGDSERGQWFFRAAGSGQTTILIREMFRGKMQGECSITVVVKK